MVNLAIRQYVEPKQEILYDYAKKSNKHYTRNFIVHWTRETPFESVLHDYIVTLDQSAYP
jgi:hypothetical protein